MTNGVLLLVASTLEAVTGLGLLVAPASMSRSSSIIRTVFPDAGPFIDFIAENVSVRQ